MSKDKQLLNFCSDSAKEKFIGGCITVKMDNDSKQPRRFFKQRSEIFRNGEVNHQISKAIKRVFHLLEKVTFICAVTCEPVE